MSCLTTISCIQAVLNTKLIRRQGWRNKQYIYMKGGEALSLLV